MLYYVILKYSYMMIKDCALLFKGFLLFLKSHILENVLSKTGQVLGLIPLPSLSIQDCQISNFCLSSSRRLPKALLVSMHQVLCLRPSSDSQPLLLSTESANPRREKELQTFESQPWDSSFWWNGYFGPPVLDALSIFLSSNGCFLVEIFNCSQRERALVRYNWIYHSQNLSES